MHLTVKQDLGTTGIVLSIAIPCTYYTLSHMAAHQMTLGSSLWRRRCLVITRSWLLLRM